MDGWNPLSQSAQKMPRAVKQDQVRRFGEFHGEDGMDANGKPVGIWSNTPFEGLPTGY